MIVGYLDPWGKTPNSSKQVAFIDLRGQSSYYLYTWGLRHILPLRNPALSNHNKDGLPGPPSITLVYLESQGHSD